jgi:hypothetical protein
MSQISFIEKSVEEQLTEELLLRSVVDFEFRNEFKTNANTLVLPSPVSSQDMSFVEMVKDALDIEAQCRSTCISGFTLVCDGNTIPNPQVPCRSTCISGYTVRCDGTTL